MCMCACLAASERPNICRKTRRFSFGPRRGPTLNRWSEYRTNVGPLRGHEIYATSSTNVGPLRGHEIHETSSTNVGPLRGHEIHETSSTNVGPLRGRRKPCVDDIGLVAVASLQRPWRTCPVLQVGWPNICKMCMWACLAASENLSRTAGREAQYLSGHT